MESSSEPWVTWVNAASGTALLGAELVLVLAELEPLAFVALARVFAGGVSTPEEGVKRVGSVVALEPAVADADAEKDVLAAAPVAPEEALDWMYNLFSLPGSFWNCGWASRITWYWLSCVYMVLICLWPKASYKVLS